MITTCRETVSVDLVSNGQTGVVIPWVMRWRGRIYKMTKIGLHHVIHEGRTLCHIFSVTDGVSDFRLQFNTETLHWKLLEMETG